MTHIFLQLRSQLHCFVTTYIVFWVSTWLCGLPIFPTNCTYFHEINDLNFKCLLKSHCHIQLLLEVHLVISFCATSASPMISAGTSLMHRFYVARYHDWFTSIVVGFTPKLVCFRPGPWQQAEFLLGRWARWRCLFDSRLFLPYLRFMTNKLVIESLLAVVRWIGSPYCEQLVWSQVCHVLQSNLNSLNFKGLSYSFDV